MFRNTFLHDLEVFLYFRPTYFGEEPNLFVFNRHSAKYIDHRSYLKAAKIAQDVKRQAKDKILYLTYTNGLFGNTDNVSNILRYFLVPMSHKVVIEELCMNSKGKTVWGTTKENLFESLGEESTLRYVLLYAIDIESLDFFNVKARSVSRK